MGSTVLTAMKTGIPFILSGPTGSGKTTLAQRLVQEFPTVVVSVSFTTRDPRHMEVEGRDYFFVSEKEFKQRISAGDFLEHVELYGCYYGTSREWVQQQCVQGKHVFLVIDTQGARMVKQSLKCCSIFLVPPSLGELERRLELRSTESKDVIQKRLEWDKKEIEASRDYDYQVVNDDLETAYHVLRSIVIAETHRNSWRL